MGGQRESQGWCYQIRKNMTHLPEEEERIAPLFKNIEFLSLIKV